MKISINLGNQIEVSLCRLYHVTLTFFWYTLMQCQENVTVMNDRVQDHTDHVIIQISYHLLWFDLRGLC